MKTFLNGTMPALTNISVGSLCGTSGADGTTRVPVLLEIVEEAAADVVGRCHEMADTFVAALRQDVAVTATEADPSPLRGRLRCRNQGVKPSSRIASPAS